MRYTLLFLLAGSLSIISAYTQDDDYLKTNYCKQEVYIPMRDGEKLYTAIYSPKDSSVSYPIMMVKTPYGIKPYGEDNFPERIGPSVYLEKEKYIFVHQDARGMFMSTGKMEWMTPHLPIKPDSSFVDNSSDTYDAVEWLLRHTNNNGNVGLWGISYRGFYASSGIIDAHPAIKCSSPQAPIANWFIGDDAHHHGAFALLPTYLFIEGVDQVVDTVFTEWPPLFNYPVKDAYNFFLNVGRLSEVNERYFEGKVPSWNYLAAHPDYDEFWQKRNILPHLKNIDPAVMVTAGLFDHENLWGSLQTYQAIRDNSENNTRLILGPWIHGGWARTSGENLGPVFFGTPTSDFYQKKIEVPFFNYYLKRKGLLDELPPVTAFTTGTNTWSGYSEWPPSNLDKYTLYLDEDFCLCSVPPASTGFIADEYISDPMHPVPYTQIFHPTRLFYNKEYMVEDQRFAAARPDVLSYATPVLEDTLIFMGPVTADLYVSASSGDFDLVVKIIDVYPDTIRTDYPETAKVDMAGYQQLVRGEIFRAKYRNSYETPQAVLRDKIEKISIPMNDINHAFLPGHRIMMQIQSSWFPMFDRNPQKFMNIYEAEKEDFRKATLRIYHSREYPSGIRFGRLP